MYMPKLDAEKVTVKGSHGDSSLQRESDSFRVKRKAVQSSPQRLTTQIHNIFRHQSYMLKYIKREQTLFNESTGRNK